jgi:hypothetical protein
LDAKRRVLEIASFAPVFPSEEPIENVGDTEALKPLASVAIDSHRRHHRVAEELDTG